MMRRIVLFMVSQLFLVPAVFTQSDVDALRYSMTTFGGTARYMSMAGAFGSLGADFSTLSSNPAGIGLFSKSEFTITPSFYYGKTKSEFNRTTSDDYQYNFHLGNVGLIIATEPKSSDQSIFTNFQFGFGMNRTNNFNTRMLMEGYNNQNSMIDTYVDNANGIPSSTIETDPSNMYAFDLNLAWWTFLIDTLPGSSNMYRGAIPPGGGIWQRKEINSWGSMNEMVVSGGTNIQNRLFLGLTFGFPFIRYFEESLYSEIDLDNSVFDFKQFSKYDELTTTGSGFNMKFGMIARPADWIRIGGAIHSPTWYSNMRDTWFTRISSEFDNGDAYSESSPYGSYNYRLETPWRALGSLSFILYQRALLSVDYEYVDFSQSRLRAGDYNFFGENREIRRKYTETHNVRLGSEVRFDPFAVRGGFGYYMSPFASNINDASRYYFTGGVGYRDKNFFIDLAYVRSLQREDYYFYGSENVVFDPVKNTGITSNLLITLGFRM
jgi:hypothetical protein